MGTRNVTYVSIPTPPPPLLLLLRTNTPIGCAGGIPGNAGPVRRCQAAAGAGPQAKEKGAGRNEEVGRNQTTAQ
jgi:hypothetical protein